MKLSMNSVAMIITDNTPSNITAYVKGTWEDYGAKLWWDTIIVENTDNCDSYQALSPREHSMIECGLFTLEDVEKLVNTAIRLFGNK